MMNQFCFSCSRGRNISRNHKRDFPSSLKKLQWPLLDSVSTSNCFVKAEPKKLNLLSKIGRENKCPNDANIFNLLSWRQEHLEGIGLITFVTNKICEEMDIDVRKIAAIKVWGIDQPPLWQWHGCQSYLVMRIYESEWSVQTVKTEITVEVSLGECDSFPNFRADWGRALLRAAWWWPTCGPRTSQRTNLKYISTPQISTQAGHSYKAPTS